MQKLQVALVWHLHQPDYRDPASGRFLLPWTYLHAVKDYGEMLRIVREVPGTRLTFNLVPILLEQLANYADDSADDVWLEILRKNPEQMTQAEQAFAINSFFSVHAERHIAPHPRYRELARLRDRVGTGSDSFRDQDLRDLQVWFLLAWSGHYLRAEEKVVQDLLRQGSGFDEQDKQALLACYRQVVNRVVQAYRDAESQGLVELSLSPYAHPILPLLCDSEIARCARRDAQLPAPFHHPEDALCQLRYGRKVAGDLLGNRPRGIWPPEGAVSAAALTLLQQEGALWAASDEAILAKSLSEGLRNRTLLYRPYQFQGLPLLFRDRELSDRIGFVYARWNPAEAAADLIQRLRKIAEAVPDGLVALILDGENCWESYADNGYPFLHALYSGLRQDPSLQMVTVSEGLAGRRATALPRLAPGSWINGDFDIWIGHPEENKAWDWLRRARQDVLPDTLKDSAQGLPAEPVRHLLRAEGSDWFWWFGDHHATAQAETFDGLFRRQLQALYRSDGKTVPDHLYHPIKEREGLHKIHEPLGFISPQIDGRVSDYFEWLAAGRIDADTGGTMHAGRQPLANGYYGYDREHFYLRLDFAGWQEELAGDNNSLEIRFDGSRPLKIRLWPATGVLRVSSEKEKLGATAARAACGAIFELSVSLSALGLEKPGSLGLSCHLYRADRETSRWPDPGRVELSYRGAELPAQHWFV